VGTGLVLYSLADSDQGEVMYIGLGTVVVASAVYLYGTLGPASRRANDEKFSAFATYDRDLRETLRLCADGLQVVPCENLAGR
jgi:hypothetical protein